MRLKSRENMVALATTMCRMTVEPVGKYIAVDERQQLCISYGQLDCFSAKIFTLFSYDIFTMLFLWQDLNIEKLNIDDKN